MITSKVNYDNCSCSTKNEPVFMGEIREETIFETVKETKMALEDIFVMLQDFSRAIEFRPEKEESITPESYCFRDDIRISRELAFAIREDLKRLMAKFIP